MNQHWNRLIEWEREFSHISGERFLPAHIKFLKPMSRLQVCSRTTRYGTIRIGTTHLWRRFFPALHEFSERHIPILSLCSRHRITSIILWKLTEWDRFLRYLSIERWSIRTVTPWSIIQKIWFLSLRRIIRLQDKRDIPIERLKKVTTISIRGCDSDSRRLLQGQRHRLRPNHGGQFNHCYKWNRCAATQYRSSLDHQ